MKYNNSVLKNEVDVELDPMRELFKTKRVFVAGYGSLLYSSGWKGRGQRREITPEDLIECRINHYERGQFGLYMPFHYYGVIRDASKYINAVLVELPDLRSWDSLMYTEVIAGFIFPYNYRVVDVTTSIRDVVLPKNSVVHMVVNEPQNRILVNKAKPAFNYYEKVWKGVQKERTSEFITEFIKTGGIIK